MATEIERKFLVLNDNWRENIDKYDYMVQGYMTNNEKSSIRIRTHGRTAKLNIKSKTIGIQRSEYEYSIPLNEAKEILDSLCYKPLIEKTRYYIKHVEHLWEIDVFEGENKGLIVSEIELSSPNESFSMPDWAGKEVSQDPRYYNTCLISNPYKNW